MKRTAILVLWCLSVGAAFLIGRESAELSAGRGLDGASAGPGPSADSQLRRSADRSIPQPRPDASRQPSLAAETLEQARSLADDGRVVESIGIIEAYLLNHGSDVDMLFLLSDLRQMTGDVELALEPLLAILRFPPTAELAERARKRLDLLVTAREQQLINAGDMSALIGYFERLSQAEPPYDGHRLKLARWLLRSGRDEEAERLFREMGLEGVTQSEIDALAREIRLARLRLPVETEQGALYTKVQASTRRQSAELRLLVDTGATMTGVSVTRLKALGAEKIEDGVRVQTANGVALLPVYRLASLNIAGVDLEDLVVLGFTDLPRNADGLLGTDVLGRLPGGLGAPVGLPLKAR